MNTIVICFDEKYVIPASVLLESIAQSNKGKRYNIYMLVSKDVNKRFPNFINLLTKKYKNFKFISIEVDISNKNLEIRLDHISIATFYRLLIPLVLPQSLEKCLYLDCDTVVVGDLEKVFTDYNISNYYIAGVKAPGQCLDANYCMQIGVDDPYSYINAGVLLYNLKKIRNDKVFNSFQKRMGYPYKFSDQDIINVVCQNNILTIPLYYNLYADMIHSKNDLKTLDSVFGKEEVYKAICNPVIYHFPDVVKPWGNLQHMMSNIWWKFARSCVMQDKINIMEKRLHVDRNNFLEKLKKYDRIFIAGFSYPQKCLANMLSDELESKFIGFIEERKEKIGIEYAGYLVYDEKKIEFNHYDLVIIIDKKRKIENNQSNRLYFHHKYYLENITK